MLDVALGRVAAVLSSSMPRTPGRGNGKGKPKGGEDPPEVKVELPERPVVPPDDASDARWQAFAEQMSAYAKELEFLQSGKPSGSFANRKEMRLDTFDGAYEGLPRWISQLRAAARLRGWQTQL